MNAAAALRASYIAPLGGPPISAGARTPGFDVEARQLRRRTFVAVEYRQYKEQWDLNRIPTCEGIYDVPLRVADPTCGEKIKRMFTFFPYRDANWIIAVLFIAGSLVFIANAFLGLVPFVAPEAVFPGLLELSIPVTTLIGAGHFIIATILTILSSWNADKGTFEPAGGKASDTGTEKVYHPALLGSPQWSWWPTWKDFIAAARTVPFQATMIQFIGGIFLTTAAVFAFPGMIDPEDINALMTFGFLPVAIGGSMLFVANLALLFFAQEKWYKPKPLTASWQGPFWSTVGGFNFMLAGLLLLR